MAVKLFVPADPWQPEKPASLDAWLDGKAKVRESRAEKDGVKESFIYNQAVKSVDTMSMPSGTDKQSQGCGVWTNAPSSSNTIARQMRLDGKDRHKGHELDGMSYDGTVKPMVRRDAKGNEVVAFNKPEFAKARANSPFKRVKSATVIVTKKSKLA